MHEEEFEVTEEAADQIRRALREGRRIIACGTTAVRVLETICRGGVAPPYEKSAEETAPLRPLKGKTRLFIYPPFEFKIVHAIITNFHFPRTTLLMLVSAFAGRDLIAEAYEKAIRERYRFYSYGDAMLIL